MPDPKIKLSFEGPDVTPATLDARVMLEMGLAFTNALQEVVAYHHSQAKDPILLTVVGVEKGSARLVIGAHPNSPEVDAPQVLAHATRSTAAYLHDLLEAPEELRGKLGKLSELTKKLTVAVGLKVLGDGWSYDLTEIVHQPEPLEIRSSTKLRGQLVRAGGKRPSIGLDVHREGGLVTLETNKDLAQIAGKLLYREVDVLADIVRSMVPPHYPIIKGRAVHIEVLPVGTDAVQAWDEWYVAAGYPLRHLASVREEDEEDEEGEDHDNDGEMMPSTGERHL